LAPVAIRDSDGAQYCAIPTPGELLKNKFLAWPQSKPVSREIPFWNSFVA